MNTLVRIGKILSSLVTSIFLSLAPIGCIVFPVDTGDENAEVTSEHSVQIDFHESIRGFLDYESEFGRDDMYSHIVSGGVEFRW